MLLDFLAFSGILCCTDLNRLPSSSKFLPSGFIKHGWLENPRTEWRFLARKISYFYGPWLPVCSVTVITRGQPESHHATSGDVSHPRCPNMPGQVLALGAKAVQALQDQVRSSSSTTLW